MGGQSKFLASTILSLSLFAGAGQARPAASDEPPPQTVTTVTQQVDPQPKPAAQTAKEAAEQMAAREEAVREQLQQQSRDNFEEIARRTGGGYTRDLGRAEKQLTRYLRQNVPERPAAAIIDPHTFDTAMALNMTPKEATERILAARNVSVPTSQLEGVASAMADQYKGRLELRLYTQNPSAHFDDFAQGPQVCVIVPVSHLDPIIEIPGLSRRDNTDFINRHEAWHCMDTQNSLVGLDKEEVDKIKELENAIGNEQQMKAISIGNRGEILADVGAAGDMIRAGKSTSIIDHVINMRKEGTDDIIHYSVAALEALRREVNQMGVGRLRTMTDAQAKQFYERIADQNAMTPEMAEIVITYRTGNDDMRTALRAVPDDIRALGYVMDVGRQVYDGADPKIIAEAVSQLPAGMDKAKLALTTLQETVAEMGVERFRNLTDADAQKLTSNFAEKDLSQDMSDIVRNWRGDPEERAAVQKEFADFLSLVERSVAFAGAYDVPPGTPQPTKELTAAEKQVMEQLGQWNAMQLLQDRAFRTDGKITPETLARAYGDMQDDLDAKIRKEPDNLLYRAQTAKLQQSFITTIQTLDYIKANADRGVDIFKVEPGLKAPSAPAENIPVAQAPETPETTKTAGPAFRRAPSPSMGA